MPDQRVSNDTATTDHGSIVAIDCPACGYGGNDPTRWLSAGTCRECGASLELRAIAGVADV